MSDEEGGRQMRMCGSVEKEIDWRGTENVTFFKEVDGR